MRKTYLIKFFITLFLLSIPQLNYALDHIKINRVVKSFPLEGEGNRIFSIPSASQNYKILYFGFTSCPDICPITLNKLTSILSKESISHKVEIYFIDLDWKKDDGNKAHSYAQHFGKKVSGYTSNQQKIKEISSYYKAYFKFKELPNSALKYTIDHSSFLYLISPGEQTFKSLFYR